MKYIKYRNDFLDFKNDDLNNQIKTSLLINEALENDIRWGDSLIGRLINSSIRKLNIYRKRVNINKLVEDFKHELNLLLEDAIFSEEKKEIEKTTYKYLLLQIFNVVNSDRSSSEKIGILIGDKPKYNGMVQQAINEIDAIEQKNLPEKDELLDSLKKFNQLLIDLDIEPTDTPIENKDNNNNNNNNNNNLLDATKKILWSVIGLNKHIKEERINPQVKSEGIITHYNSFFNTINELKMIGDSDKGLSIINPNNKQIEKNPDENKSKEVSGKSKEVSRDKWSYGDSNKKNSDDDRDITDIDYEDIKDVSKQISGTSDKDISLIIWKKIVKSFKVSGLYKMIPKITELLKKSESDDTSKKIIISIGKQLIANNHTIGKNKLTYNQLIKENSDLSLNKYGDISKAVSLLSNVILPISENIEVVKKLGEPYKHIVNFINGYKDLESNKNESKVWKLYNENSNEDEKDDIQKSWYMCFNEGDEKKWNVKDEDIKILVNKSSQYENKKKNIDTSSDSGKKILDDHIVKIVNIFGKAWDKYAVDEIPSGRENAKISHKTFREYIYLGKSGQRPKYDKDAGPGYGPWGNKKTFDIWQNGITKILEDGKYRKVLANINFISKPEEETNTTMREPGSGITLFNFINEMLGYGEDIDFRSKRERIFKKYFNSDKKIGITSGYGNQTQEIKPDDKGDSSKLLWGSNVDLYGRGITITNIKENGLRKFFKLEFVDKDNKTRELVCYPVDIYDSDRKKYIIVRFHMGAPSSKKESMISTYMKNLKSDTLKSKDLPISMEYSKNTPIYIAAIPIGFHVNSSMIFKYIEIGNLKENMETKDLFEMEVNKIKKITYLKYLEDRKNNTQISHLLTFAQDDLINGVLKEKPTNDRNYKNIKDMLFKEIDRGIFDSTK